MNGRRRTSQAADPPVWKKEDIRAIIQEANYQVLVSVADNLGAALKNKGLTTSQIRNVFGEVKRLQSRYDANRLLMLKPKLAYMGARAGQGGKELQRVLSEAIDQIFAGNPDKDTQQKRFQRMVDFFEAILAYHKAYGGRS